MSDIFYVRNSNGGLVPAKFLYINNKPIYDPNSTAKSYDPQLSKPNVLYDVNGNLLPDDQQNVNGQLIVPANYSVDSAMDLANSVVLSAQDSLQPDLTEAGGLAGAFITGGPG